MNANACNKLIGRVRWQENDPELLADQFDIGPSRLKTPSRHTTPDLYRFLLCYLQNCWSGPSFEDVGLRSGPTTML